MAGSRQLRRYGAAALLSVVTLCATLFIPPIRARVVVLLLKVGGQLGDVPWSDVMWMLGRKNGVDLPRLAATRNPYESIESPRRSRGDLEAGKELFQENCSACHGDQGRGGVGGPSLHDHIFRQGRSDWALFRTINRGISGTAMVARNFPRDDCWRLVSYLKTVVVGTSTAETEKASQVTMEPVTAAELRSAEDHASEWLTYSGSYAGHRYSRLSQINRSNVGGLRVEWERQLETSETKVETSPLVRGSTMFVTEPPNRVHALDAATGKILWTYSRDLPAKLLTCCGPVNRGVALLGDKVFVGTLDAHLVALDAKNGQLVWDAEIAPSSSGYSITAAPLAIEGMVLTGVAGGEFGIRGFLDAYDAATGQRRWRFYTVPEAGQTGSETWEDNSLKKGGAPTWMTGAYDPELKLIYWGVGNPSPDYYGENRKGDNLYSNSVVALDAESGRLRWYFQFTPHDLHDWDSVQVPVLVDTVMAGVKRKLMAWANRNGFYYLLDRTTGKFLLGAPFVKQTWTDGLDGNGRPQMRQEAVPTPQGSGVYPGIPGGTNWWPPAFDPEQGLLYVPTVDRGTIFYGSAHEPLHQSSEDLGGMTMAIPNEDAVVGVRAIEASTGKSRWQHLDAPRRVYMEMSGLLSTSGKLVFGGDAEDFFALDAETGKELWRFPAGTQIWAAPISYELGGRQYVAVAAGRTIVTFALPPARH